MSANWKNRIPPGLRAALPVVALAALGVYLLAGPGLTARPGGSPKEEEAAIQKNAEAFVEAFHKGDAKGVAAFWATDGDYIDQTGRHLKGREE